MISSKFSRSIAPLAFATLLSGGMLVHSSIKSNDRNTDKIENIENKPIENPALLGTLFTLGLLGTTGAAVLAKAVDVRYKDAKEDIGVIYDVAELNEDDGVTKAQVLDTISDYQAKLNRVAKSCNQDKNASRQLNYLAEEVKSAVEYGYDIEDEDIKHKIAYQFDKATMPKSKWKAAEENYKKEFPNIEFDKANGIKTKSFARHAAEKSALKELGFNWYMNLKEDEILNKLEEIENYIDIEPEILNKYDRKRINELISKASLSVEQGHIPEETLEEIAKIYVFKQQTY